MTDDEYREHITKDVDACLVCGVKPLFGAWTDYNGQIKCWACGATYQILGSHFTAEFLAKLGITADQVAQRYCDCLDIVPIIRDYWNETQRKIPIGCYFGKPSWTREDADAFIGWLHDNEARFATDYPDAFNWQKIREWSRALSPA